MRLASLAALVLMTTPPCAATAADFAGLKTGDRLHRFEATAVYLDAADRPIGARFMHDATGFTLDLLQIESAPQAFIWVNSFPTSDQGEPHTQEHLLLGGRPRPHARDQGLDVADHELGVHRAVAHRYYFHTVAGVDIFFDCSPSSIDALLNPDYTDEEIRREVRNFGVNQGDDGKLRLEEKGTVYNEMVASMANGSWQA